MLPDFAHLKGTIRKAFDQRMRRLVRQDPLLSMIKERRIHEGDRWAVRRGDGTFDESGPHEICDRYPIDATAVKEKGLSAILPSQEAAAERVRHQQEGVLFDRMKTVIEETGNVVDAGGQPFSFELFLNLLRKVDIDFDENGKPHMPALVVSPEMGAIIANQIPEWQQNEAKLADFEGVLQKKKEEWLARESLRKLAD